MRWLVVTLFVSALALMGTPQSLALEPEARVIEILSKECCKICRKGKACGDSCIARDKDCHQPPGCACDG